MPLTAEQIELRKQGVGASEIAALLGEHPSLDAFDLWQIKTGKKEVKTNQKMRFGQLMEPVIAKLWMEECGKDIELINKTERHPIHSRMLASPDAWYPGYYKKMIEFKTAGEDQRYKWGKPGSDEIPPNYFLQCQQTMIVWNAIKKDNGHENGMLDTKAMDVVVLFGNNDLQHYVVELDNDYEKIFAKAISEFWLHVSEGTPPQPIKPKDAYFAAKFPKANKDLITVEAGSEVDTIVTTLREIQAAKKKLESAETEIKHELKQLIGDKAGLNTQHGVVLWENIKEWETFNANTAWVEFIKWIDMLHSAGDFNGMTPGSLLFDILDKADIIAKSHSKKMGGYRKFTVPRNW